MGGLYGVALGRIFFGESMFSRTDDASKVALVHLSQRLAAWGFVAIDCQVLSDHLVTLGAREVPREGFTALLERFCPDPGREGSWDDGEMTFPSDAGGAGEPGPGLNPSPSAAIPGPPA